VFGVISGYLKKEKMTLPKKLIIVGTAGMGNPCLNGSVVAAQRALETFGHAHVTLSDMCLAFSSCIEIAMSRNRGIWPKFHEIDFEKNPHMVPNHYPPAPKKIEFKSKAPAYTHKIIIQPLSGPGFKRGQRR